MTKKFIYFSSGSTYNYWILCLLVYGNMNMVSYINMSFYVGGLITFFGLSNICNIQMDFFDIFTDSMRKVFTPKHMKNDSK